LLSEFFVPKRDSKEDESLEDFACRRLGKEAFVRLVEPIVGGIFTADPQKLSMQATLPQFVEMEREHGGLIKGWLAQRRRNRNSPKVAGSRGAIEQQASGARYAQFLAPKQGMSWWIEEIAKQLTATKIHLNANVKSLQRNPEHVRTDSIGRWSVELGTGEIKSFDAVVIATPSKTAGDLLQPLFADVGDLISRFRAASSAVAVMIVRKKDIAKMAWCFGIVVPAIENRRVLAISFTSLKYPGRVQDDEILVRLFLGGAMHPELLTLSNEQLLEIASEELREIIEWDGKARWSEVIRWESAMPQYDVGHLQQVELLEKLLESHDPTVRVAGATYRGVGVPQCIRSGRKAIEALKVVLQPK
jgi:oxygen-dependent protoporphyrinogen oxidase